MTHRSHSDLQYSHLSKCNSADLLAQHHPNPERSRNNRTRRPSEPEARQLSHASRTSLLSTFRCTQPLEGHLAHLLWSVPLPHRPPPVSMLRDTNPLNRRWVD